MECIMKIDFGYLGCIYPNLNYNIKSRQTRMGCVPQKQARSLDFPPTGDFTLYETGFNSYMYVTIKQPK